MTALLDIAEFRSEQFAPRLPDESQVNPGVYGAELAFWLCTELADRGVVTTYPNYEDWGWFIEYFTDNGAEFAVHCGNIDGESDRWLLSLRRHGRKMFGRDKPPFSEASTLIVAIRELLKGSTSIQDLTWTYPDEHAT